MRRNQNLNSNPNDKSLDESKNIHIPNNLSEQGNNSLKKIKTFQNYSHQNNKKNTSESLNLDLIFSMLNEMNSKLDIMNEKIDRVFNNKNNKTHKPKNLLHENNQNLLLGKKRKSESINNKTKK